MYMSMATRWVGAVQWDLSKTGCVKGPARVHQCKASCAAAVLAPKPRRFPSCPPVPNAAAEPQRGSSPSLAATRLPSYSGLPSSPSAPSSCSTCTLEWCSSSMGGEWVAGWDPWHLSCSNCPEGFPCFRRAPLVSSKCNFARVQAEIPQRDGKHTADRQPDGTPQRCHAGHAASPHRVASTAYGPCC